jgi:serine/threonine protein kinase
MASDRWVEQILVKLNREGNLFPGYHFTYDDGLVELGESLTSMVYQMVQDNNEEQTYALKVIFNDTAPSEYFQSEVHLQNQVSATCENVVRIINTKEYNGPQMYLQMILMEQVEPIMYIDKFHNPTLTREELKTEEGVLRMTRDIARALMIAHRHGILHRDVKLENIFWDEKMDCYKLGDFGVATAVITDRSMTRLGSEGYVAPEIMCVPDKSRYNSAADIYSLGMCLYVLLNNMCFPGTNQYKPSDVQYDPEYIYPAPVNASEKVARIVRTMCSYNPMDRFDSMESVLVELNGKNLIPEEEAEISTFSDEKTVRDEKTVYPTIEGQQAPETPMIVPSHVEADNAKRLRQVEEKNRNKMVYKKVEWRYALAMVIPFIVVISVVFGNTNELGMSSNHDGILMLLLACVLTLTPSIVFATIPGVILVNQFSVYFKYAPDMIPDDLYRMVVVSLLVVLIHRLLGYRIRYKQGKPWMIWYYRILRCVGVVALLGIELFRFGFGIYAFIMSRNESYFALHYREMLLYILVELCIIISVFFFTFIKDSKNGK